MSQRLHVWRRGSLPENSGLLHLSLGTVTCSKTTASTSQDFVYEWRQNGAWDESSDRCSVSSNGSVVCSSRHTWSQTLTRDWKSEILDTSGWKEFPPLGNWTSGDLWGSPSESELLLLWIKRSHLRPAGQYDQNISSNPNDRRPEGRSPTCWNDWISNSTLGCSASPRGSWKTAQEKDVWMIFLRLLPPTPSSRYVKKPDRRDIIYILFSSSGAGAAQKFSEVTVKLSPSETGQVHSKRKLSQRLLCLSRNTFLLLTHFYDWIFYCTLKVARKCDYLCKHEAARLWGIDSTSGNEVYWSGEHSRESFVPIRAPVGSCCNEP